MPALSDAGSHCDDELMVMEPGNSEDTANIWSGRSSPSDPPLPLYQTNIPRICCALLASMTTGGTTYAFGLYGNTLKKTLHLTQSQLDTISTANFCAGLLSWLPGMFVDRYGTRLGISVGGVTGATAVMLFWLVSKTYIQFSNLNVVVAVLSILGITIFLSCALITGAVFKIISCNCGAGSKGSAVGVAKGYVGLGAGAYACIFQSIKQPTTSDLDFLPMVAFFFLVAATLPSWIFLPKKQDEYTVPDVLTPLHFRILFASLIVLAGVIVGSSLSNLYEEGQGSDNKKSSTNYPVGGIIVFIWMAPIFAQIFLPQKIDVALLAGSEEEHDSLLRVVGGNEEEEKEEEAPPPPLLGTGDKRVPTEINKKRIPQHSMSEEQIGGDIALERLGGDEDDEEESDEQNTGDQAGRQVRESIENKNLFQMLQTASAWLMLWTTTILVGGGTLETNNMGQMVESLGFSPVVTSAGLALFSVAQGGGRVITGALSESALGWNTRRCGIDNGVPRPFFLVMASVAGVIAHTILAISSKQISFLFGIFLSGYAFGSVWPLLVLITAEIYGTANVGANYMFYDGFTSAGGTFLLSKVVAQEVYESHIDPHYSEDNDGVTCYGQACFQLTHVVIVLLSLTCVVTSTIMQRMTRDVYNKNRAHHR